MTKTHGRKIALVMLLAVLIECMIFAFFASATPTFAIAEGTVYSNVLDDLKKDGTFDTKNYPVVSEDYSLRIIQLAESADNELFVYVYQPCGKRDVKASSINVSLTSFAEITPDNYKLKYINSSGVFFKYAVEGVTVSNAEARYYGVTSIFRPFSTEYGDEDPGHGNTVTEVPYKVSKEYRFSTINGNPVSATVDIETIEITDKFVGFVRYDDGYIFHESACDSHFVAFDTDKPIDRLVEADVTWVQQSHVRQSDGNQFQPHFGEATNEKRTLSEEDETVHYQGGGIFAGTYTWDRIQKIDEFIASVDLNQNVYHGAILDVNVASRINEEGKQALKNKKWVLRFADTAYDEQWRETIVSHGNVYRWLCESTTIVSEVTILRLKFVTDGVTYNLGVIDNKQSGSDKPINDTDVSFGISSNVKLIFYIILLILLILLLWPILPYILKFIGWVVLLPFRGIKALIKNRNHTRKIKRGRRNDKRKKHKKNKPQKRQGRTKK